MNMIHLHRLRSILVSTIHRIFIASQLFAVACSSSYSYRTYVVPKEAHITPTLRKSGTVSQRSGRFGQAQTMTVRYNDGNVITEIEIPVLSSGQTVLITPVSQRAKNAPTPVPQVPSLVDRQLVDSYTRSGGKIIRSKPDVSLVKMHGRIQGLVADGQYSLALEMIDLVLQRYPQHPEFLRMQGSCYLSIGEKSAAIAAYEKAQQITPDDQTEALLKKLTSHRN